MKAIDYSYFIEKYIAGEMTPKERLWFEKELEDNDSLKREIELRRKTDQALTRYDIINLRNKLSNIEKARKERETIKISQKKLLLRSAAVAACFILLGSLYLTLNKTTSTETIINEYFTVYNPGGAVRNSVSTIGTYDVLYKKALALYKKNDYKNAADLLKDYIAKRPEHMEAHLIYGVASMKNNDFEEAAGSFLKIISNGNNLYIDNARWYLSLCYLSLKNTEAARTQLMIIKESESIYKTRAEKILKRIR